MSTDERINDIWKLDENGGISEEYLKEIIMHQYNLLKKMQKSVNTEEEE